MMQTRFPINHYLHLREQGKSHADAFEHTVLRYGITPDALRDELRQSRAHHLAVAALIPEDVN